MSWTAEKHEELKRVEARARELRAEYVEEEEQAALRGVDLIRSAPLGRSAALDFSVWALHNVATLRALLEHAEAFASVTNQQDAGDAK